MSSFCETISPESHRRVLHNPSFRSGMTKNALPLKWRKLALRNTGFPAVILTEKDFDRHE